MMKYKDINETLIRNFIEMADIEIFQPSFPLISLEGMHGAGKTTQIEVVQDFLYKTKRINGYYFELPTLNTGYGHILKCLYKNTSDWLEFADNLPWFNPLFILLDMLSNINSLEKQYKQMQSFDYVIMSRGVVSTYLYNTPINYEFEDGIEYLKPILKYFPKYDVIFYLCLPAKIARDRVLARGRQLRMGDELQALEITAQRIEKIKKIFPELPIKSVDATQSKQAITDILANEIHLILQKEK